METLRYRTVSSYYDAGYLGNKASTNFWKLANDIFLWGGFGIWSTATFTQLLAVFGVAEGLNFFVWEWGVLGIFGLLNATYAILSSYAYDSAYKAMRRKNATTKPEEAAAAKELQADIQMEWNTYAIEDFVTAFTLTPLIPYWYAANGKCDGPEVHQSCPEDWDSEAFMEEKNGDDASDVEAVEGSEPEDFEVWEEKDGDMEEPEDEDEIVEEPVDPIGLNIAF